jgi:hypothetical protein
MPGESSGSSSSARASARTVLCGSCDFSKRMEASVRSFSATDVLRTLAALKFALSRTMEVVPSEMALSRPPMTPAMAIGPGRVRDHEIRGRQFVLFVVQRDDALAVAGGGTKMVSP